MGPRKRLLLLTTIMALAVLIVDVVAVGILYATAIDEETARLQEAAQSQARLIEAVARFDAIYSHDYPLGARAATLSQIMDAHARYRGFGDTGEFVLAQRRDDQILFLLSHRHFDLDNPRPVPWTSTLAQPMRLALSGVAGTVVGIDYRGEEVLAAHEPIAELNLGIVAKIDVAEVRAPFVRAALWSAIVAVLLVALGAGIFSRVVNPLIRHLEDTVADRERALREVKTLRGILPICSFCKKIRDDRGAWDQVEVYVRQHTEANFSHGICPECLHTHYSDVMEGEV